MHRGSRKHVLDWVSQPRFAEELLHLAAPVNCRIRPDSRWKPRSFADATEARLETFGPEVMPDHPAWPQVASWWLAHQRGANTPNWDIALSCDIEGQAGLVLVEAKANVPELGTAGKTRDPMASDKSLENHERIAAAITEARLGLTSALPGIAINRDAHYQLSNRLAFAWRLTTLGIPTVLMYLGFTGDEGIRDVGEPFATDQHWQDTFGAHLKAVCPTSPLSGPVQLESARFWVVSRSKPVLEISPSRS